MMKKLMALLLVLVLSAGLLASVAVAAETRPEPKKVTYFNNGDEPSFEAEYEDAEGNTWIETYLVGNEVKKGDPKGPLGFLNVNGKNYHLLGIQTIDSSNKDKFYKDPVTGRWVVKDTFYLAGAEKPKLGQTVFFVIETGKSGSSLRMSKMVKITVPANGKKVIVDVAGEDPEEVTLELEKVSSIKKGKKLKLTATLKLGGNPVSGQKIIFKLNGKTYTAVTKADGTAKVTVPKSVTKKLKAGKKVTIQASYGGISVQRRVKVKK